MVRKIQDYHQALINYVNSTYKKPFKFTEFDCATYAIGAIEAMIGQKVEVPELKYSSLDEIREYFKEISFKDEMMRQLDAYEVKHKFEQPGDIIIIDDSGLESISVVIDKYSYAPVPDEGVKRFQISSLRKVGKLMSVMRFD